MHISRSPARVAAVALLAALSGCARKRQAAARSPLAILDQALAPATLAAELHALGGAHFHATTMFRVEDKHQGELPEGSKPASPPAITTTTDVWMDKHGNFRLVENNDQDGGREIVRVGRQVAVALRYDKMIRRASDDKQNARFLDQALGGPWSAWEIARRQVEVAAGSGGYRLQRSPRPVALPAGFPPAVGLRKWRASVQVGALEGQAVLDPSGKALRSLSCKLAFSAVRDGLPIDGKVEVAARFDDIGKTADVVMPDTDTLHPRQRTILEEKALLGGLGAALSASARTGKP